MAESLIEGMLARRASASPGLIGTKEFEVEIELMLNDPTRLQALARSAFEKIDKDKTGFIDESELAQVMIRLCGEVGCPYPSAAEVSLKMQELDVDGNGKIDLQEFEALIR